MTTAIIQTAAPEAPVRVGPPSRLEILRHARELALDVGAVRHGLNFFENDRGGHIPVGEVATGQVSSDAVCGVCIAGAYILADVILTGQSDWESRYSEVCLATADADDGVCDDVTQGGTEYVVAVLDQMIADEEAARA